MVTIIKITENEKKKGIIETYVEHVPFIACASVLPTRLELLLPLWPSIPRDIGRDRAE